MAVRHKRALVIGHRGFSAVAPENTLAAFELALAAEVDLVELDYRQSADGQLVVIHDAELDRTTDARLHWGSKHIRVETKTAWEIRRLDAGSWFDPRYSGARVPLLSEALELIQARGVALLERKSGAVESTAQLLEKHGMAGRVLVQSFDWTFLKALHARLPNQPLAALGPQSKLPGVKKAPGVFGQLNGRWLSALRKTGANVVVWNKQVSRAAVRHAHDEGLKVWVYTIDRPELANHLLDVGVDGLITNNPARMWKTMVERNF
jgi:glycerophosphoryl diester phosphodiesterase